MASKRPRDRDERPVLRWEGRGDHIAQAAGGCRDLMSQGGQGHWVFMMIELYNGALIGSNLQLITNNNIMIAVNNRR